MDDVLELEIRRKIYNLIRKNPGLHLSKIAEMLKMRISHVEYHTLYLEKNQVISVEKAEGYSRYYIKGKVGLADKKIISILRREIPLKIVLLLLDKKLMQHKELIKNFDIAASTLSYHLDKLVKSGIISYQEINTSRFYSIVERDKIIRLILEYKPYNLFESFKDIWDDLKVD